MPYVNCSYCHKEIYRQPNQLKDHQRSFCNKRCHSAWRKIHWTGENSPAYKGKPPKEFTCSQCGQIFLKRVSSLKNNKNIFCSRECKHSWQRENKVNQHLKKRISVKCEQCGIEFERTPGQLRHAGNNLFCSRQCFEKWRSINLRGDKLYNFREPIKTNCTYCNKIIYKKDYLIKGSKNTFCNHDCYSKWLTTQTGDNAPRWNGGKITVKCANCGKQIERTRSEVENRSEKFFCNVKCAGEWRSKNLLRENHPNWKGRIIVQCSYCGGDIEKEGWRPKTRYHFCNYECSGKWQSENLNGDARYNWKGGRLPYYGPNWSNQKYKARKRDNFTCQVCGITETEHIEKCHQKLHVHHVVPFRTFGYVADKNENYKQANDLSNLITACQRCHRVLEAS